MTRVGVVDLGTNSTRLLVAEVEHGTVSELERRLTITRLGEGVDGRRLLLPTAIARVRNALTDYRRTLDGIGVERTLAVATSAVREAENGEAFLGEVEWSYGFDTRLLSGDEEALMTFAGVFTGRDAADGTLVVDVGGGSTELVLGGPDGVAWHISLALGCVRLTERFLEQPTPVAREPPEPHRGALAAFRRGTPSRAVGSRNGDDVGNRARVDEEDHALSTAHDEQGLDRREAGASPRCPSTPSARPRQHPTARR